jgi:hypothetical protein
MIDMDLRRRIEDTLTTQFGSAFTDLPLSRRLALVRDLHDMYWDEDFTTYSDAARELSRRIGGPDNLASYAEVQHARLTRG